MERKTVPSKLGLVAILAAAHRLQESTNILSEATPRKGEIITAVILVVKLVTMLGKSRGSCNGDDVWEWRDDN